MKSFRMNGDRQQNQMPTSPNSCTYVHVTSIYTYTTFLPAYYSQRGLQLFSFCGLKRHFSPKTSIDQVLAKYDNSFKFPSIKKRWTLFRQFCTEHSPVTTIFSKIDNLKIDASSLSFFFQQDHESRI